MSIYRHLLHWSAVLAFYDRMIVSAVIRNCKKKLAIMSNNNLVRHAMCRTHHHQFGQSLHQLWCMYALWLGNMLTKNQRFCQFKSIKLVFHLMFHLVFWPFFILFDFFFFLSDLCDSGMEYFRHFAAFCRCVVHLWTHTYIHTHILLPIQ